MDVDRGGRNGFEPDEEAVVILGVGRWRRRERLGRVRNRERVAEGQVDEREVGDGTGEDAKAVNETR